MRPFIAVAPSVVSGNGQLRKGDGIQREGGMAFRFAQVQQRGLPRVHAAQ